MKKLMKSTATAIALLLALPACAQAPAPAADDADPALWVVKDADTTIYLFGTVHVLKPGLSWFDEAVKAAFDKSDQVVLELVMPDPAAMQAIAMAKGMTATGPTLTEQLPEARRPQFAKAVTDLGFPPSAFDRMRPWLAAATLSILPLTKLGYDQANGPETIVTAAAKAANKPVIGLETPEQQMGIFAGLSQPAQIQFLTSTLDELPKIETTMATMVDHWADGNPEALAAQMNETLKDSPEVAKALLEDRNKAWATWIGERMKAPGTVFIAVGAGHLAGAQSVQAQLKTQQLTAERVTY